MSRPKSILERFEDKCIPVPESGCWIWIGAIETQPKSRTNNLEYGKMTFQGKLVKAHRVAWMLLRGEIPTNKHVLHKCDVPLCVNPDHLYIGTNHDNINDKVARGRTSSVSHPGMKHAGAKLTDDDVRAIRASNKHALELAKEYGICWGHIYRLRRIERWRHI